MAGVTAGIIGAGVGTGLSLYNTISSAKQKRRAQNELNDYDRQVLDNAFENIPINTAGSDLLREQGAQTTANMVDALQNGGTRAIIGGLPRVGAYVNEIDRAAARNLDDQYTRRDYAAAADNARIERITEDRDIANINALSTQVDAGRQGVWDGLMGFGSSIAAGAREIGRGTVENPQVTAITDTMNPAPLTSAPATPITASTLPVSYNPNFGTNYAPLQYAEPYFDFAKSYVPPAENSNVIGPSATPYPYFNFATSFNGF